MSCSDGLDAQDFLNKFTKLAPGTLSPPSFPTDFLNEEMEKAKKKSGEGEAATSGMPDKLTFSFFVPHQAIGQSQKVGHIAKRLHPIILVVQS